MGQDVADIGPGYTTCVDDLGTVRIGVISWTGSTINRAPKWELTGAEDDDLTVEATTPANFATTASSILGSVWTAMDADERTALFDSYAYQRAKTLRVADEINA